MLHQWEWASFDPLRAWTGQKRGRKGEFRLSVWTEAYIFSCPRISALLVQRLSDSGWNSSQWQSILRPSELTELHLQHSWFSNLQTADHGTAPQPDSIIELLLSIYLSILPLMPKKMKLNGSMNLQGLLELIPKIGVFYIIGNCNANVESQEILGVAGKFGLWVQNEAGQSLTEFCQENTLVIANTLFQQHKRWLYLWNHQMSILKSDWSYSLQSKMEKLYTVS